jgi:hypothetical protein
MTLVETPALGLLCNNAQLFRASGFRLSPRSIVTVGGAAARVHRGSQRRKRAVRLGRIRAQNAHKEGVHNVHTLGFGFGCTGVGLGRTGDVSGEWRIIRGSGWFESHLGHVFSLFRGF